MFNETSYNPGGLGLTIAVPHGSTAPQPVADTSGLTPKQVAKLTKWGFLGPGGISIPGTTLPAPSTGGEAPAPAEGAATEGGLLGGALPDWALWVGIGLAALFFFKK